MKVLLTGGILAALACGVYAGQSSFTLRQLQELAVQNSPDLKSLKQKLNAASAAARQQGNWANPEFETTIDGSEQDFSLRQPVDLWGKRSLARRVWNADATVSAAKLESTRQGLRFQVAQQFWALASATEAKSLLDIDPDCVAPVTDECGSDAEVGASAATEIDNGLTRHDWSETKRVSNRRRGLPDRIREVLYPSRVVSQFTRTFLTH